METQKRKVTLLSKSWRCEEKWSGKKRKVKRKEEGENGKHKEEMKTQPKHEGKRVKQIRTDCKQYCIFFRHGIQGHMFHLLRQPTRLLKVTNDHIRHKTPISARFVSYLTSPHSNTSKPISRGPVGLLLTTSAETVRVTKHKILLQQNDPPVERQEKYNRKNIWQKRRRR